MEYGSRVVVIVAVLEEVLACQRGLLSEEAYVNWTESCVEGGGCGGRWLGSVVRRHPGREREGVRGARGVYIVC